MELLHLQHNDLHKTSVFGAEYDHLAVPERYRSLLHEDGSGYDLSGLSD
jgi:hypothetical protein